jgi:large subunit ribosomal protein L9
MATKLLLIEDVDDLGRCGEVVNVRPGFARNFLLPRKLAVIADKGALRMQARLKEERQKRAIVDKQEAEKTAASLEGVILTTIVKVDHEGQMYGSVSVHDIVHLLQEQANITFDKRSISLKHPIKQTGNFEIGIKLKEGISSIITLKVIPEESKHPTENAKAPE